MAEPQKRMLTPGETRVMEIVNQFNRLCEDGAPVGTLIMSEDAVNVLDRYQIAQPVKTEKEPITGRFRVFLTIAEFQKYLQFACKQVGFTLLLNGGVKTNDGLYVDPVFPNDANPPLKKGN